MLREQSKPQIIYFQKTSNKKAALAGGFQRVDKILKGMEVCTLVC
ncbi:hypothetical protein BLGI_516 [Brevibacillus laterosporus GI-9]|nr:hypothetical protein BLGI_516 [Brevibacillus laterosporus GI-9]